MDPKPILISIEGDIGAGKSTLINQLRRDHPDWHFIDEPVGTWLDLKNDDGSNLLELFYNDKERYSYTFQNCALLSRALNIQKAIKAWQEECQLNPEVAQNNVFITERCLETDFHVFAQMLHDDGYMNGLEWNLYKMWYDYVKSLSSPLSGILYVCTPPSICAERIRIRGRKEEETIRLDYLQALDTYQRGWLSSSTIPKLEYINYMPEKAGLGSIEEFVKNLSA